MSEMESRFTEHRLTPHRRLVLQIFLENRDRHLSAEELYNLSREKEKEIGIATIYRTLELLEELGLLRKVNFGDGRSRYELIQMDLSEHHHHHLLCLSCNRIIEVEEDLLHQLEDTIEQKHHFSIVNHNLQFFGYCKSCQKNRQPND